MLSDIETNIDAARGIVNYDTLSSVFNSKNKEGEQIYEEAEKARALNLKSAVDAYQDNPNDQAARDRFLKLFEEFRGNVNDQYGNTITLSNIFGSGVQQAQSARARVLATQLQLAYRAAATAGQTGRTLSDKDLANFLQIVGYGGAQNAETIKQQLYSFTTDVVQEFDKDAQIFNWQTNPQQLARYLGVNLKVDPEIYSRALTADGEAEREEVLNQLQRKIGPAGTMFFTFVENPDDGTFSLRIHDFEGVAGKSQVISDILGKARSVSGGKPAPGTKQQRSGATSIQLKL